MSVIDRYAPSPTSRLHLGNLRTALAGWLLTRQAGGRWLLRVEDLDEARVRAADGVAGQQLDDLDSLGLDWDGEVVWQSQRKAAYAAAVAQLGERTYECFCTRREIAEASSAPHDDGYRPYPGTCSRLSSAERARRRGSRPAAIRIRSEGATASVVDLQLGEVTGLVDDFVLVRGDGAFSYNLAVTVDDMAQGVNQVTRGADLLTSAPRQAWLTTQLGGTPPRYSHIGLVTNPDGARLAKRDGSVTLGDLAERGWDSRRVLAELTSSLGLGRQETTQAALGAMPERGLPQVGGPFWLGAVWHEAEGRLRGQ